MNNGVDPQAFAAEHKAANPTEQRRLIGLYAAWIKRGTAAQSWRGGMGIGLVGIAVLVAAPWTLDGHGSLKLLAGCSLVGIWGVLLTRIARRREWEWRRSNPFNDWRRSN